jgi:CRP-like cAMP-binding protein
MAEKSKFWYLRHFNIFEGLDEETLKAVDKLANMCTFKTNDPIYFPAEPSHCIYFLKKGHVKISRISEDGKEIILDIIGPGEVFGELLQPDDKEERNEIATAIGEVLICNMLRSDFEKMLRKYPELNFRVTKEVGTRLRKVEERVTELVFKDVKKRIASFLVRYAEEFGVIKSGIITIKPSLSHQELGFLTGASRQTVTTILNDLRTQGIIDFDRKQITVNDVSRLKKIGN